MPLTAAEKQRVRYHLGYPSLTTVASLQFQVPALTQTNFLVENNLNRLLEEAIEQVRSIVKTMDGVELRLIEAQERLAAIQLEDLHLREDEPDKLEQEYRRWGYRLADLIGSPIYPYSMRYQSTSSSVRNISVRN